MEFFDIEFLLDLPWSAIVISAFLIYIVGQVWYGVIFIKQDVVLKRRSQKRTIS